MMTDNLFHKHLPCWTVKMLQTPGKEQVSLDKPSTFVVLTLGKPLPPRAFGIIWRQFCLHNFGGVVAATSM